MAPDLIDTASNTADHWYRQGAEALERGALEQAAGALWQCLVLDAGHASALHLLGKVRLQQGQQEAALALQLGSWRQDPALGWNAFAAFYDLTVERVYTVARVQTASKEGATTRVRDAYLRAWSDLQHKGARDLAPLAWIVSLTT